MVSCFYLANSNIPAGRDKGKTFLGLFYDESGKIPANVKKLMPVFGEQNIKQITTITTVAKKIRITEQFSVSNIIEL